MKHIGEPQHLQTLFLCYMNKTKFNFLYINMNSLIKNSFGGEERGMSDS